MFSVSAPNSVLWPEPVPYAVGFWCGDILLPVDGTGSGVGFFDRLLLAQSAPPGRLFDVSSAETDSKGHVSPSGVEM